jgi:hypothetical protein
MVTPILLLGLTDAGWVRALALLNLIVAIGVLAGACSPRCPMSMSVPPAQRVVTSRHPSATRSCHCRDATGRFDTPATTWLRGADGS